MSGTSSVMEKLWMTKAGLRASCWLVHHGSHRCGYVEVLPGHPLYEVDYSDLYEDDIELSVHGGVTYSGQGKEGYPGDGKNWWFGFDCAHCGDQVRREGLSLFRFTDHDEWRDEEYVTGECEELARQLMEIK